MSSIAFEKIPSTLMILNPFNNFAAEVHQVEVRKDPLLGDTSIYNPSLRDKARAFFGENDPVLIKTLAEESARQCIFCGEQVLNKTACYPPDILSHGRLQSGEAVLFANLFSVGAYHPVIALGSTHFLKLPEFTPRLLADGFKAGREFLRSLERRDPSAIFATLSMNYLLPAGASMVHPHMQLLATPTAYSYHARMLDAGRRYRATEGTSYFDDLVAEERREGERYIRQQNRWHWIAAFSPMGSNEITAIHEHEADFAALTDQDLGDLADGMRNVLLLYDRLGHLCFNVTLYAAAGKKEREDGFRCILKIISRQNLYPNYRNDDYFLQKMLQTELIFHLPEDLAELMKK